VDESHGGTLTLPQVPGFALTILPGSATFPGGARTGCVTVTPVNGDKVPMSPGFGQQPRFVVTIQPVGTLFNPPAALTLPNVDGLLPRQVTEMYSYDHDLASFVAIGTGTVSEDGLVIRSDPGVGVLKAGWHCGGNPNPTGVAATCPTCSTCQGTNCVPDNSQTPPQTAPDDCKKQICASGTVTTVNDNSEQPPDVCDQCQGGSATHKTDPAAAFPANTATLNGPVAPTPPLGACTWGLTWEETITVDISARCNGGQWTAVLTTLTGNYSQQTRLLPAEVEVTGPTGNTTQANFCAQVTELKRLGACPGAWYMLAAVVAHENVHLTHFQPGLANAAPAIETAIEGLSVPTAPGKTQAQAIAEIKALPGYAAAVAAARATWFAADDPLLAHDHDAGGLTETAEHGVVDPMIATICTHARAQGWGACAACPP
jgi:hypothetical protein